jgi:hypothetical protein
LVLETFVGPCPEGMQCAHLNGDPSDNRLVNLAWVTPTENQWHRVVHGTALRGEQNGFAKLTEADVKEIRARWARGDRVTVMAKEYGVERTAIDDVVHRTTWRHVE